MTSVINVLHNLHSSRFPFQPPGWFPLLRGVGPTAAMLWHKGYQLVNPCMLDAGPSTLGKALSPAEPLLQTVCCEQASCTDFH